MDVGHVCYILQSRVCNRTYIGYTVDPTRRIRQHNGELVGGAKRTIKGRPWTMVCYISGFYDASQAMRFEWKWQHSPRKKRVGYTLSAKMARLNEVIAKGDGLLPWPPLQIHWLQPEYCVDIDNVMHCLA